MFDKEKKKLFINISPEVTCCVCRGKEVVNESVHSPSCCRCYSRIENTACIIKFKPQTSHNLNNWKNYVPELVLVANSNTGKLNARNVFYCYVNVSVTLVINDDSVGNLIDE